jgi:hypothetical protein
LQYTKIESRKQVKTKQILDVKIQHVTEDVEVLREAKEEEKKDNFGPFHLISYPSFPTF